MAQRSPAAGRQAEWPAPQIAFLISADRCARRVVRASGVLGDQTRVGHLQLTTDPGDSRDDDCLIVPLVTSVGVSRPVTVTETGGPSTGAALEAGLRAHERIYARTLREVRSLVGQSEERGEEIGDVRLFVIACIGDPSGAGLLLPILLLGQRLRKELAGMGVSLGRYIVLVLPPPAADESHQLAHRRAGAILVTLDAASTFGLTIGGERLQAPVGEGIVVVGHPDHMQPSLQRQVRESAEILRVLADQGPLGDEVRARLRQRAGSEPGRGQIFQLIGVASIVFDPAPIAALLAQLALDMDARARALRTPREGTA